MLDSEWTLKATLARPLRHQVLHHLRHVPQLTTTRAVQERKKGELYTHNKHQGDILVFPYVWLGIGLLTITGCVAKRDIQAQDQDFINIEKNMKIQIGISERL